MFQIAKSSSNPYIGFPSSSLLKGRTCGDLNRLEKESFYSLDWGKKVVGPKSLPSISALNLFKVLPHGISWEAFTCEEQKHSLKLVLLTWYFFNLEIPREACLGLVESTSQLCHWEYRFFPKEVKNTGSRARLFGSESQVQLLIAVWPWANYLTSLSHIFLIC